MMSMCSIARAHHIGCHADQYAQYEGLTVNAAEAIDSAGGTIIASDGRPMLTTPEAEAGLENLVTAYADGNIPQETIAFTEEDGRLAFEAGNPLVLRSWPYVDDPAKNGAASAAQDTLGMAALPGLSGPGASSLGSHSAAASVFSKAVTTSVEKNAHAAIQGQLRVDVALARMQQAIGDANGG